MQTTVQIRPVPRRLLGAPARFARREPLRRASSANFLIATRCQTKSSLCCCEQSTEVVSNRNKIVVFRRLPALPLPLLGPVPVLNKTFLDLSQNCVTCHEDAHRGQLGQNCRQCHNFVDWKSATKKIQRPVRRIREWDLDHAVLRDCLLRELTPVSPCFFTIYSLTFQCCHCSVGLL
jgi:hypothetical protein